MPTKRFGFLSQPSQLAVFGLPLNSIIENKVSYVKRHRRYHHRHQPKPKFKKRAVMSISLPLQFERATEDYMIPVETLRFAVAMLAVA